MTQLCPLLTGEGWRFERLPEGSSLSRKLLTRTLRERIIRGSLRR